jgi:hypothetical protein
VGVALAASTLLAAGCGSDSLSTTDLATRAAAACTTASKLADAIASPASPAGGAAFLRQGVGALRPELAKLRALTPPDNVRSVYGTAINALSAKVTALDRAARDLQAGGDPVIGIRSLQQTLSPLEQQEDQAWRALGIDACVNR